MNDNTNINYDNYPVKGEGTEFLTPGMKYTCVGYFRKHRYNVHYHRIRPYGPKYYKLLGSDGGIVVLVRDDLFDLMHNSQICVDNLKLSSDGRIYSPNEYQQELGNRVMEFAEFRDTVKTVQAEEKQAKTITDRPQMITTQYQDKFKQISYIEKGDAIRGQYNYKIRNGMVLNITRTSWCIRYVIDPERDLYHEFEDHIIYGTMIQEHLSDLNKCYCEISDRLKKYGGIDWKEAFCDRKYRIVYNAEVGKFLFGPACGKLRVSSLDGISQWIRDVEACEKMVYAIRDRLGWKLHKGLMRKMFNAY